MKIFCFSKKGLKKGILIFALGFIFLVLIFCYKAFNQNLQGIDASVLSPIYSASPGKQQVGLMINVDWGEEIIPKILAVLEQEKIPVTFFITGRFADNHPELVKQIGEKGHEIANHGYSHPHPDQLSIADNQMEIQKTQEALEKAGVKPQKYFAAAYGEKKEHVIKAAEDLGYQVIYWTLDTVDWQEPTVQTIIDRIVPNLEDGALILAHPKQCTLEALPELARQVREKNLEFNILSELID